MIESIFYLLFVYIYLVSGLLVNFLQLCSMVIWPFNKSLYRKVNWCLVRSYWSQFTFVAEWWSGCDCILYMHPDEREHIATEHIVVTMNHTYEIDWLMAWIIAERYDLIGGTKIYGKESLRFVPTMGWSWIFVESIFLKRDWNKDKKRIHDGVKELVDFPDGYWFTLLLFPEGTRYTPEKHEASCEVARQKGYPELKHHLLPRTKGFAYSMQEMKGKVNAVYDCTIEFKGDVEPSLMNVLRGKKIIGHMRIRRHEINNLPDSEEDLGVWLRDLFKEKDELVDEFKKTGKFDLPAYHVPRKYNDLLIWLAWAIVTCLPLFYFLGQIFVSGTFLQQVFIIGFFLFMSVAAKWLIGWTETKKGSKYGMKEKKKNK